MAQCQPRKQQVAPELMLALPSGKGTVSKVEDFSPMRGRAEGSGQFPAEIAIAYFR